MRASIAAIVPALLISVQVALAEAQPLIPATAERAAIIARVIDEMKRNYGGTLVTAPADEAIDSSAFVERYLAAFREPDDIKSYDYHFERLLARVARFPKALDDSRLDEPVWEAFLALEKKHPSKRDYQIGDTVYSLDSAQDLLWIYLGRHAGTILKDGERRRAWMRRLLEPSGEAGQLIRSFASLHLVSSVQKEIPELIVWDVPAETSIPGGRAGLEWFAEKTKVDWVLWGMNLEDLASPSVDRVYSGRWETKMAVDQESWSKERSQFQVSFFLVKGQRVPTPSVRVPTVSRTDGIFMMPAEGRVHIFAKKHFHAGVLRVLEASSFVSADEVGAFSRDLKIPLLKETAKSSP